MSAIFKPKIRIHTILLLLCGMISSFSFSARPILGNPLGKDLIKVILFSGKNNHEWQKTTPLLIRIFRDSKRFNVSVTERPDTLSYITLKKYQLIISNWNTWPDNKVRLNSQWENDYERYVNEGGGVLSFHAGASSFYDWEAYHRIGIGRWGKETRHGPRTKGHVYGFDQNHPVTRGMGDFYIMDEIWEKSDIFPGSIPIGSVSAKDEKDGHLIDFPTVFAGQNGKGRCFFTALGHDERALLNSGLQTLLLRAGEWCAGKEVTIEVPDPLKIRKDILKDRFMWHQSDTTLTLKNHSEVVWQFNYNDRFGKTYFHPLNVGRSTLSCVSPPDHPWHLGLWFSWKFINGINYWEYLKNFSSSETGFKSEGVTTVDWKKITLNSDFSSVIHLNLLYHPIGGKTVLAEERSFHISRPSVDGSYYIDEDHLFKALTDSVLLDRTPIKGEPGGQSWGGYSGLSIRFNEDFTAPEIISPADSAGLGKGIWLYMGFNDLTGGRAGMLILNRSEHTPKSARWYVINDPQVPFYYFSPAVLFDHNIVLKKGESLRLKYRIWMLPGSVTKGVLQEKQDQYLNQ